jgi:hypothetical protein
VRARGAGAGAHAGRRSQVRASVRQLDDGHPIPHSYARACDLRHRSSKAKDHFVAMVSHEARAAFVARCSLHQV